MASGDTQKDIEEAEMYLATGRHNVFKLKIGWQTSSLAIAHVTAIIIYIYWSEVCQMEGDYDV